MRLFRSFGFSIGISLFFIMLAYLWAGTEGAGIALLLGILEVSFSFDNAVVNASVLRHWDVFWRKVFLMLGIIVAVFGMRFLFPLVIVSVTTGIGLIDVGQMAIYRADEYLAHLTAANTTVSAFGGAFLLMVFLDFILDAGKEIHWIAPIEKRLLHLAGYDSISLSIALLLLISLVYTIVLPTERLSALAGGVAWLLLYVAISMLSKMLENGESTSLVEKSLVRGSIFWFLYLEVLDASFSLDGVIGAFAITRDIVIIMLGLGIGAVFVRSLTIYLVEQGTLDEYIYLEHGAHWAIGVLAVIIFIEMRYHVPEPVTGFIGVVFIGLSLYSSIQHNKQLSDVWKTL